MTAFTSWCGLYMNDMENGDNPYDEVRYAIQMWERRTACICKTDSNILQKGKVIEQSGIKPKDALHIACAIAGGCDYFITTDGELTNKTVAGITIVNPARFIYGGDRWKLIRY
ncbi:MAG: type II toxin-antitoxin system VapC family toxin [Treponematales bacterium]